MRLLLRQNVVAVGGDDRDVVVCLGARQRRVRLRELLIEVRGIDLGQYLAGLYVRADILVPALQVAVDARVDRRLVIGLDASRQREDLVSVALLQLGERDGRNNLLVGPPCNGALTVSPLDDACGCDANRDDERSHTDHDEAATAWGLGRRGRH